MTPNKTSGFGGSLEAHKAVRNMGDLRKLSADSYLRLMVVY
jgi:hypothetical protein